MASTPISKFYVDPTNVLQVALDKIHTREAGFRACRCSGCVECIARTALEQFAVQQTPPCAGLTIEGYGQDHCAGCKERA